MEQQETPLPEQFEYDGILFSNVVISPKMLDGARNLKLTPDDTLIVTYHKSGTNWMKYMAYLVMNNGRDGEENAEPILQTVPYLEMNFSKKSEEEVLKMYAEKPSPRLFCTHLPFRFLSRQVLEDNAKAIVVMRNPKDNLVSCFHFYRMAREFGFYTGPWDDFFELFKQKKLFGGDFFDQNIGWWKVRDRDNVLVVFYEEMKADLEGIVRKVAKFMGYQLSDDVIQNIVHLTSFKEMKNNPRVNGKGSQHLDFTKSELIRKGEVGGWRNYFSEEQSKYIDGICEEQCLPIGLNFMGK